MGRADKARKVRTAKEKMLRDLSRTDSETTTGTSMFADSSKENISSSSMIITTKKELPPPSVCMEARVILVDLKYSNLLSQRQRRELKPKRRRTSSVTSDRTKHFLKKLIKEEAEWMSEWTSSSAESLAGKRRRRGQSGKRAASKSKGRKKTSTTLNSTTSQGALETTMLSKVNVRNDLSDGKTFFKPRGRPKKKVLPRDENYSPTIAKSSFESRESPAAKGSEGLAKDCNVRAAVKNKKQRVEKKRERKDQVRGYNSHSQGEARRSDKKVFNYYERRVDEEKSALLKRVRTDESYRAENSWICSTSIAPRCVESYSLENNRSKDGSARCSGELEIIAGRTAMDFCGKTSSMNAPHENKFSSEVNGDSRSEDFNNLQTFLQPLEKKHCSLDSIQRAIENDLATGNHLLSFEDSTIDESLPTDHVIMSDILSLDDRIASSLDNRPTHQGHTITQGQQQHHRDEESSREIFDSRDSSCPPASSNFRNSARRKRPEIIQDALFPRGTIDYPSMRIKVPRNEAKRRKMARERDDSMVPRDNNNITETTKLWKKMDNFMGHTDPSAIMKNRPSKIDATTIIDEDNANDENPRNIVEITSEEKLSGALRNWTNEPEIAALLDVAVKRGKTDDYSRLVWYDSSKNDNQHGPTTKKTESTSTNAISNVFSISPLASPPISNVSDERKAMSELLFALDHEQPIELTSNKLLVSSLERSKTGNDVSSSMIVDATLKSQKPDFSTTRSDDTTRSVKKLTVENLDKFNTSISNVETKLSAFATKISDDSSRIPRPDEINAILSRKRKWTSSNDDSKASKRNVNGKIKLMRKFEKPEENWRIDDSSKIVKRDFRVDDHFERSAAMPETKNERKDDRVFRELPSFGESSVRAIGDNGESRKSPKTSSSSSCSSSSSSSRSSSSDGSTSDDDKNSIKTRETSCRATNNDTLDDIDATNDFGFETTRANRRIDENRGKNDRTKSPERMKIKGMEIDAKDGNEESRSTMENMELRNERKIDDNYLNVDDIELDFRIDNTADELSHAETPKDTIFSKDNLNEIEALSKTDEIVSDIEGLEEENIDVSFAEENGGENTDNDKEDCISLFTESLCMSRCASPALYELTQRHRSPKARESYARMKSANIGKFVMENNRECEEIFKAYENDGANFETIFERESILEPLYPEPTKSIDAQSNDNKTNSNNNNNNNNNKTDLRSTLTNRLNLRNVTSLFRGQCFAWLRNGNCNANNANACRFMHSLKPNLLQALRQSKPKDTEALTTYAIDRKYWNFMELIREELMSDMSVLQVKLLYEKLYRARTLTISYIQTSYDVLKSRGLTTEQIITIFRSIIHEDDGETNYSMLIGLYKKIEAGTCWMNFGQSIGKYIPPIEIIETIIREAIDKNCENHASNVWRYLGKNLPYPIANKISPELWKRFHAIRNVKSSDAILTKLKNTIESTTIGENGATARVIASPDSPGHEPETPIIVRSRKSSIFDIASPAKNSQRSASSQEKTSRSASSTMIFDASYNLQPIDKLPSAKCPYGNNLWKFHWDLKGVQEGLRNKDYAHVISILSLYSTYPNRLPHIEGFYNILCKEITSAKHHIAEIVRLTVQSGTSDALRLYVYDLGICVLTKLADVGAWRHAYELLKTFELYGEHNSCAFTLLAAEVYIANRRPSKALDLLEKSRIVCTNTKKWRQMQCWRDQHLRLNVMDLLLYSLCDGHADHALRLLDFMLRDQCNTFQPINLAPHVDRIARLVIFEKRTSLIVDMGRLILQAKLIVNITTFRSIINHVFHEDRILARQLHRYATWLGAYNRAKINGSSCAHMIINTDWTEEETFLMITSLIEDLYVNIGHAIERLKPRQLGVFLIFEAVPTERQLATDISTGVLTTAGINKYRDKVKEVLSRFDPKIKMVQRSQGRICKLQSQSLVDYLKSGQITL